MTTRNNFQHIGPARHRQSFLLFFIRRWALSVGRLLQCPICRPAFALWASAGRLSSVVPASPRLRRASRHPSSGFTLIELLVVMVIAVVIMSVSLPSFISMGRGASMRTAVNNVSSTLALSRQWAITHREEITFFAMNTLVYPDDSGTLVTNPAYCAKNQSGDFVQKGVPLPLDVQFAAPTPTVSIVTSLTFKTDGGLTSGSVTKFIELEDKNHASIKKTISINGLTGGIKVE